MKRAISFVLALSMCLSLCACGKGKQVKSVEKQISQIGDISLENQEAILAASEAYKQLPDEEKGQVENYGTLENAVNKLEELEKINEDLSELESMIVGRNTENAEKMCLNLLENENLSEEQAELVAAYVAVLSIEDLLDQCDVETAEKVCLGLLEEATLSEEIKEMLNIYLTVISMICFAGTYLVLPQYIGKTVPEEITGTTVAELMSEKSAGINFYYESEKELNAVMDSYLEYLSYYFTLVSVDETVPSHMTAADNYASYVFCDENGTFLGVTKMSAFRVSHMMIFVLSDGMFDYSKINSDNPDAGIWEPVEAAIPESNRE